MGQSTMGNIINARGKMKIGDRLRWKILKFSFQVIQIQIQQRPNGGTLEFREGGGGAGEGRKQKKKAE